MIKESNKQTEDIDNSSDLNEKIENREFEDKNDKINPEELQNRKRKRSKKSNKNHNAKSNDDKQKNPCIYSTRSTKKILGAKRLIKSVKESEKFIGEKLYSKIYKNKNID